MLGWRLLERGPRTANLGPRTGVTGAVSLSDLDLIEGGGAQDAINAFLRQYKQIRFHHALDMRSPVPEAVLEKAEISGAEKWG